MPQQRRRSSNAFGPGTIIILILLGIFYFYQMYQARRTLENARSTPQPAAATVPGAQSGVTTAPPGQQISAWFTDPLAGQSSGGIENNLVQAVRGAQKSVDIAIYNLSLPALGEALVADHSRGVQVRLVMESEAMDKDVPRMLIAAGIPIAGDQREGLMHNKFAIIDGQEVWTGSMNYTASSAYQDFNNLVRLRSPQLVQDYAVNFDEMFVEHKFGPDKQPNTPYPQVTVGQVPVEVYFSPDDGVAQHVLVELRKAKQSIDILAYSFTSNDMAAAIITSARAGVRVRGVFDESQREQNTGEEFDNFKKQGLDVHLDGIPGLLHDKVIIIDGRVVITGSYNFTASAERANDENLLIIHDAGIAAQYLRHFEQVYGSAQK